MFDVSMLCVIFRWMGKKKKIKEGELIELYRSSKNMKLTIEKIYYFLNINTIVFMHDLIVSRMRVL